MTQFPALFPGSSRGKKREDPGNEVDKSLSACRLVVGWYSDHVPSMDSARESWALLVTGLLVNTLFVNQITKQNIRKGIRLQSQKKTVDRDNDVGENNRNLQHNKSQNINLQSFSVSLTVPSLWASSPLRVDSEASRERTRERAAKPSTPRTSVSVWGCRVTSRDSLKRACSKPNASQSQ